MKANSKRDLAVKVIEANLSITANRALAKILFKQHPLVFKDLEDARLVIRGVQNKSGKTSIDTTTTAFTERLARLRAEVSIDAREQSDKTPYAFGSSHNKALVVSDTHIPFIDMRSLDLALEYGYTQNVDCIIINGDFLDFSTISRFSYKPSEMRVVEQLENGLEVLKYLQGALGVKVVYHEGNHCYVADTQVLTKDRGFVYFTELTSEDEVAQFDSETREISYAKPISVLSRLYKGEVYTIENSFSRQKVTDLHDVVVGSEKKKAKDIEVSDLKKIPTNGFCDVEDYDINDDYLRFLVNIVSDATLVDNSKYVLKSTKKRVQFKISKERKITHLEELLNNLNIPYTKKICKMTGINKLQPYYIMIYGDYARDVFKILNGIKEFPEFFLNLSKRQLKIVYDELAITDGSMNRDSLLLTTTSKKDANLLLASFTSRGFYCRYKERDSSSSGFENGKRQFHCVIRESEPLLNRVSSKIKAEEYDGMVYCVEMPLGTVITMLDGKVAFSGNCNRIEQYMIRQAPELYSLNKLEKLLHLDELGVDFVSGVQYMKFGNLNIAHGDKIVKGIFAPVNAARGVFTKTNTSTMIGHVHRTSEHIESDMNGKIIGCYSTGCLTTVRPDYNPQVSKHNQGFAVVEKDANTGDFEVDNKKIINYKVR